MNDETGLDARALYYAEIAEASTRRRTRHGAKRRNRHGPHKIFFGADDGRRAMLHSLGIDPRKLDS